MSKCEYGCGQESNFITKNGKKCCSDNWRRCPAVKQKNSNGLKKAYSEGRGYIDYNSLPETTKKRMSRYEHFISLPWDQIKDTGYMKKRICIEQNYSCLICGLSKWNDHSIPLEIDHIDGNNGNWNRENVRAICPNCHASTDTYRGKNINSGTFKVSDEELIKALKESSSIRQALLKCKLVAKGENYDRAKRLLSLHE